MGILDKIVFLFSKKKKSQMPKSLLTLIVMQYDVPYIIFDRRSGRVTESSIEDYDASLHKIWIEDEEHYQQLFSIV